MRTIDAPSKYISTVFHRQSISYTSTYRPLKYIRQLDLPDGKLLFNELTGEMILLDTEEFAKYATSFPIEDTLVKELISRWFLIPDHINDLQLAKQLMAVFESINLGFSQPKIKDFTILPTTDCNARCFYCYELGSSKKWMTEEIAKDVVSFILRSKVDGSIRLRWFGGEPLYNANIIDYICKSLNKMKVDFASTMISNGYLFDDVMIERAKHLWRLKRVQITLDGTEKIYNRTKAYIYNNVESPFERVIHNIEALLKNDISVTIRLNMDLHNVDDLFNLSNFLLEKFKDYKNYYITPYLLYENNNLPKKPYERDLLNERRLQLKQFLEEKIRFKNEYARVMKYINHCMADTNTSIMILPDGKLGKCEHYIDSGFVGDIYNGITDIKIFNSYKKMSTPLEKCDQCELRPICIYLACCPNVKRYCSEYEKNVKIQELDNYIYSVYNYKKEKNNDV